MSLSLETIRASLAQLQVADLRMNLVDAGMVKDIRVQGADVSVDIAFSYPSKSQWDDLRAEVLSLLRNLEVVGNVNVSIGQAIVAHAVKPGLKSLASVRNITAVTSGKGGRARRRHLRPKPSNHDGCKRAAPIHRRENHGAAHGPRALGEFPWIPC